MTKIEWTDASWNPIRAREIATGNGGHYCVKVSAGCANCYAERWQARLRVAYRYAAQDRDRVDIFLDEKTLTQPLRWRHPRHIFVCSMTDLFADFVTDEMRDRIFAVMALTPHHTYQILTKRPERMREYMNKACGRIADTIIRFRRGRGDHMPVVPVPHIRPGAPWWPLPNVWLGVSVEDQDSANERIPHLLMTSAAIRFVSAEPLLGPINFHNIEIEDTRLDALLGFQHDPYHGEPVPGPRLDWIIAGGESGPKARPMHPDWARSLRDQCAAAGVPFFFKQWGEWAPESALGHLDVETLNDLINDCPYGEFHGGGDWICSCLCTEGDDGAQCYRVGKAAAGRLLDGVEHNGRPE